VIDDENSANEGAELDVRLAQLEAKERELSALRRKLHDRLASFPNDATAERERQLSKQRRELHAEIDALRAQRSAMRLERADPDEA